MIAPHIFDRLWYTCICMYVCMYVCMYMAINPALLFLAFLHSYTEEERLRLQYDIIYDIYVSAASVCWWTSDVDMLGTSVGMLF